MPKLLLFMLFIGLFGLSATCKGPDQEPDQQSQAGHTVQFELSILHPHCGGAPPPNEPKPSPYKQQKLLIKQGSSNSEALPVLASFTTDEQGHASVQLPAGQYCLLINDKNQSFEDFYQQKNKKPDRFYSLKDKACFEDWYAQCELQFEVTENRATIQHTFYPKCFTGDHPCMEYEGPMPP